MSAEKLLAQHLERFGRGDVEGLLSEYAERFVFFTQDRVMHDVSELRPLLEGMIAEFSQPGVSFELLARHAEGDYAYIAWRAETPKHSFLLGSDSFVVHEGKIVMQSSAISLVAKPT